MTELNKRSTFEKIMKMIRLNILAIAIASGVSIYFLFHYVEALASIKYPLKSFSNELVPYLIFSMLFIAFSKVELKRMRPRRWHFILVAFQVLLALLFALWIKFVDNTNNLVELEGIIACIITPTAAAATVITGKLGGDESSITTYTIFSNLAAAIAIPLIFPLISPVAHELGFFEGFILIMTKVFPMIVLPLLLAQFIRIFIKPLNKFVVNNLKEFSFYIWAFTLATISATAMSNMMNSQESSATLINLALIGLFTTALQFGFGKIIGHLEGQRISAGQGLGQKNMVFGIWAAYSFLSPASSIAPGCYILWQNIVNSWQLWYREKKQLTYTDKFDE